VLFAQQLILFAPHAVPPRKHTPLLLATLASTRPALRRAAASTLRYLAERDPAAALDLSVEAHLVATLDSEVDPHITEQLRAGLAALLAAGAPAAPGYWLRLLSSVALAAPAAAVAAAATVAPGRAGGGERGSGAGGLMADGDEDDSGSPRMRTPPASPPPAGAGAAALSPRGGGGGSAPAGVPLPSPPQMRSPRLRTRLFSADLLLTLFSAVGPDPRHRVPPPKHTDDEEALGRRRTASGLPSDSSGADWLVGHLQALVDAGFKMATGSADALRPAGARLLRRVLGFFRGVADPDVPEALLLEQYQAQVR
jgi:hypothetical protein